MTLRRDFLGFTAGAIAARTVLPTAAKAEGVSVTKIPLQHSDAALLTACAEFNALARRTDVIHGTGPDCVKDDSEADAASAPLFARMHILLNRMDELRATTAAGIQARAHSLAVHAGHGQHSFDYEHMMAGRLLRMLMRDSAALAGDPISRPVASSDAALLAACTRFMVADAEVVRMNATLDDVDQAMHDALDEWHEILDIVSDATPRTLEGLQAKARVTISAFDRDVPTDKGQAVDQAAEPHEWAAYRLAQDVLAMTGAA